MIDKDKVLDKYHASKINMAIKVKNLQIMFALRGIIQCNVWATWLPGSPF